MKEQVNCRRAEWTGKYDFIMSLICYVVGIANIWRFPVKAYENGGGAFLLAYVIVLVVIGVPFLFMELSFGQFGGLGVIRIWDAVPLFRGVGWAMVYTMALISTYYSLLLAYSVYYFFASLNIELPWQKCSEEWTTLYACSDSSSNNSTLASSPSQIFWEKKLLARSEGIEEGSGVLKWDLCLSLLFVWLCVFFILFKGLKFMGKVVHFVAIAPFVLLLVLLIRNSLLDGARGGIELLIYPKWSILLDIKVWYEAASQMFFSMHLAMGGLLTMSSFNDFHNNILRDTFVVLVVDLLAGLLSGFVVFAMIGHMALQYGAPLEQILLDQSQGIVFVVYSEATRYLPAPPLWSALFFLTFFLAGMGSLFSSVEIIATALLNQFPVIRRERYGPEIFRTVICACLFFATLPMCSKAGVYILHLLDSMIPFYAVVGIGLIEIIAIAWFYGFRRLSSDIAAMLGGKLVLTRSFCPFWWPMWVALTPAAIAFILIFGIVHYQPLVYGVGEKAVSYPPWAERLGFSLVGIAFSLVVTNAIRAVLRASCNSDWTILKPYKSWGTYRETCPPESTPAGASSPSKKTSLVAASDEPGFVARLVKKVKAPRSCMATCQRSCDAKCHKSRKPACQTSRKRSCKPACQRSCKAGCQRSCKPSCQRSCVPARQRSCDDCKAPCEIGAHDVNRGRRRQRCTTCSVHHSSDGGLRVATHTQPDNQHVLYDPIVPVIASTEPCPGCTGRSIAGYQSTNEYHATSGYQTTSEYQATNECHTNLGYHGTIHSECGHTPCHEIPVGYTVAMDGGTTQPIEGSITTVNCSY